MLDSKGIGAENTAGHLNKTTNGGKIVKALFTVAVLVAAAIDASAQGQFVFGNRVIADGIDAPVYDWSGARPAGDAFLAQAYVGTSVDSLSPVGSAVPFRTGAFAGYISAVVVTVPGLPGGTAVYVQMRAWEAVGGPTFEAAKAAGRGYAMSNIVPLTLAEAPNTPPSMKGLLATVGPIIPEPSTGTLGLLGLVAVFLARNKPNAPRGSTPQVCARRGRRC